MLRILFWVSLAGCIVAPAQPQPQYAGQSSCLMGSNGVQACGYDCKLGADGIAACSNMPNGRCELGADGHVYCSEGQPYAQQPPAQMPPQQCALNSDGSRTCGYNCKLGSNGYHYCSTQPNGQCALNSDGSWTCP